MISHFYLAGVLLLGPGEKYPPCDTSIKTEPFDLFIAEGNPSLESDTLSNVPKILYQERKVLGYSEKSHYYIGKRRNKILHGHYELVSHDYPSESVRESGNYQHNKREGRWMKWYATGEVEGESLYQNGLHEGVNTTYRQNGLIFEQEKRKNGRFDCKDGFFRIYHNNGNIKLELIVKNGLIVKNNIYDSSGLPTEQKASKVK